MGMAPQLLDSVWYGLASFKWGSAVAQFPYRHCEYRSICDNCFVNTSSIQILKTCGLGPLCSPLSMELANRGVEAATFGNGAASWVLEHRGNASFWFFRSPASFGVAIRLRSRCEYLHGRSRPCGLASGQSSIGTAHPPTTQGAPPSLKNVSWFWQVYCIAFYKNCFCIL